MLRRTGWTGALMLAALSGCTPAAQPAPRGEVGTSAPVSAPPPSAVTAPAPAAAHDSDNDGVVDECDHCPGEPGIDSADLPHGRGCPFIESFTDSGAFLRGPIEFRAGEARLDVGAKLRLEKIAAEMKSREHVRFFVVGHTSDDETAPGLGLARAAAVAAELVRGGVDPAKLEQHDAGAERPVFNLRSTTLDPVDRPKTRRVELDISRNHAVEQTWNEARKAVEYVQLGELASCPPEHR